MFGTNCDCPQFIVVHILEYKLGEKTQHIGTFTLCDSTGSFLILASLGCENNKTPVSFTFCACATHELQRIVCRCKQAKLVLVLLFVLVKRRSGLLLFAHAQQIILQSLYVTKIITKIMQSKTTTDFSISVSFLFVHYLWGLSNVFLFHTRTKLMKWDSCSTGMGC